jgi:glycosyltransferase involved in cell wall biosynthesis/Flp pilus assembly protein TadD
MASGPRFTVLMPAHNRADVIGYAIRSVLGQTEPDFELLVAGDGCTDGTAAVVRSFADPRIRWFDFPKAPTFGYANRNRAMREARGTLVAFAAHDDLMLPDHLERMGQPFDDPGIEWAYSRPVWVSDDGLLVPFGVDLRRPAELDEFLTVANTIPATCVVYRRACLDRVGGWPEQEAMGGDWAFWKAIIGPSGGANAAYVAEATCLHFRASWKGRRNWGPPPLDAWLARAGDGSAWPAALRVPIPDGATPQEAVWDAVAADPRGWPGRLRAATDAALAAFGWTSARHLAATVVQLTAGVRSLTGQGSAAAAMALADQLVDIAPTDPRVHAARAMALSSAGRAGEAEAAIQKAIELETYNAHFRALQSEVLQREGRTEDAIAAVDVAVRLRPDRAPFHERRGQLLAAAGRLDEAEAALREALRLDPNLASAARALARLTAPRGRARFGRWLDRRKLGPPRC